MTIVRTAADDQQHCITGAAAPQVATLRAEFRLVDCGALDAPDYVPAGGAFAVQFGTLTGLFFSLHREDA